MNKRVKPIEPNWLIESGVTDISKPQLVEPFSRPSKSYATNTVDFNGVLVMANNSKEKKIAYPLRIDESILDEIEKCQGSKNSIINSLLAFAIEELKKNNRTLIT